MRFKLTLVTLGLTALLTLALVLQATVSDAVGSWLALGLVSGVLISVAAARFGPWGGDGDADEDGDVDAFDL